MIGRFWIAASPMTFPTSVRRVSMIGDSALTVTTSLTPAGRIFRSTGWVWPTCTVTLPTGVIWKPLSVAETS